VRITRLQVRVPTYVQIEKVVELGYNFNINSLVSTSKSGFIFNHVEANTMFLTVGMKINDNKGNVYILDEIIGQGGFGYVFKAHREADGIVFAVKTTFPAFARPDSELSFKNEMRTAMKVGGSNVIRYEYVHDGDDFPELPPYIIMEYANGGTLASVIEKKQQTGSFYTNDELIGLFRQLATGMSQVNTCLVHRDVKPDNILLCNDTFKISDFGLSKVAAEGTRTLSFKGAGTPFYMAPEAWDLSKNTIQMDIYSMGIVFYEAATFRRPYAQSPSTVDECKDMHLYSPIINPAKVNPALSPSLVSLINRMLEKSSKRRFETWDDVFALLDAHSSPVSAIDKMVATAVAAKNAEDVARQQREAELKKQTKEREDHLKLVYSQYEQTILAPVIEFAEKINLQYAGKDKLTFPENQYVSRGQSKFFWKLNVPPNNAVTFNFEAILKENFTREVYVDRVFGGNSTRKENYIPQYKKTNILGWGEITNQFGYGFNILLLDSGDIYGDWIIMNNKNNFSHATNKYRPEPFAFSLQELPHEIDRVQITHLYSADFDSFDENDFIALVQALAYTFKK